jgi:primosomal protein N' (replication factor Y)
MDKALAGGEQVILFFNRRGGATFVQCRDCGFVLRCRRCEVALGYHPDEEGLVCHQCNYRAGVPSNCPRCSGPRLKFLGLGTQKVAREAGFAFPLAKLLRWDSDATRQKDSHRQILDIFRRHQADVLIGTQMVAKGLDLPAVTLVGVVSADTALNLPDFRAGERTFQLLSQVTGRAGRGAKGGKAIIQSYLPEHYAIRAAANHDYKAFYEQEIGYRRQLNNPPFNRLARLVFSHTNDARGQQEAARMKRLLASQIDERGIAGLTIIGPAPTFIHRRRGRFHWQVLLRGPEMSAFLDQIAFPRGWAVDIDPVGLA